MDKFFGGWTSAYAKQYHLGKYPELGQDQVGLSVLTSPVATSNDLPLCSASVDLDSFTA